MELGPFLSRPLEGLGYVLAVISRAAGQVVSPVVFQANQVGRVPPAAKAGRIATFGGRQQAMPTVRARRRGVDPDQRPIVGGDRLPQLLAGPIHVGTGIHQQLSSGDSRHCRASGPRSGPSAARSPTATRRPTGRPARRHRPEKATRQRTSRTIAPDALRGSRAARRRCAAKGRSRPWRTGATPRAIRSGEQRSQAWRAGYTQEGAMRSEHCARAQPLFQAWHGFTPAGAGLIVPTVTRPNSDDRRQRRLRSPIAAKGTPTTPARPSTMLVAPQIRSDCQTKQGAE